jgi:hypothetical protein
MVFFIDISDHGCKRRQNVKTKSWSCAERGRWMALSPFIIGDADPTLGTQIVYKSEVI